MAEPVLEALTQQISALTYKLEELSANHLAPILMIQTCEICGMRGHGPEACFVTFPLEEVNDLYGNSFNLSYEHQ